MRKFFTFIWLLVMSLWQPRRHRPTVAPLRRLTPARAFDGLDLDFTAALEDLGPNAAFEIANGARPGSSYLFNQFLPERLEPSYRAEAGNITIRATMAGLAAIDGAYPPVGMMEASDFSQKIPKIAGTTRLNEATQRAMQDRLMRLLATGTPTTDFIQTEILNFINKVIVQPHLDSLEWLRAQCLFNGVINWTFGEITLNVDYGVPAANFLTQRTGTDAWGGTTSKFWEDVRSLRRLLRWNTRAFIAHPDTIDEIIFNDANKAEVLEQSAERVRIRRLVGSTERASRDARDTVELIAYGLEGEVYDTANPGETIKIPFCPAGKLLAVANNERNEYRVGEGSTDDPEANNNLGYTHVGPTVEGGGRLGRWARAYTPEGRPYQLVGEGVTNSLPVLEKFRYGLAVASSVMS